MALAKTTRPRLRGVFPRKRLFRLLDAGRNRPITWLQGPPGAGKTTLIASYLESRKLPCLWYQVDEGDGDIASFFYHLRQAAPRRRRPLPLLTPEYLPGLTVFTQRFFRELYARLKTPFVLVLDNYQDASASSNFHEVIAQALAQLPNEGYAIVISRSGPPPSMARLRASRSLSTVGGPELRLTFDEAKGLARSITEDRISGATLKSIYETVDGWTAGLVLLVERMKSERQAITQSHGRTPQDVFDYFASEIFRKSDRDTQEVLLQSAFLPRVTAAMAEKLTQIPNAGQIIEQLTQDHYFTIRHDGPEPTYQYHPLFREFLFSQAQKTLTPERRIQVQKIAATLLEEAGQIESAMGLLRDAEDWETLAELIRGNAAIFIQQGRNRTVSEWIGYLPSDFVQQQPWLLYWIGICHGPFDVEKAQDHFKMAFDLFRRDNDAIGVFLSWSAAAETFHLIALNLKPLDEWISVMHELLRTFSSFPSVEIEAVVAKAMLGSLLIREPTAANTSYWAQRLANVSEQISDPARRVEFSTWLALYYLWAGEPARAAALVEPFRHHAAEHVPEVCRLLVNLALARSEWIRGEPEACVKTVSDALELSKATGVYYLNDMFRGDGAVAALSMGDRATAKQLLRDMGQGLEKKSNNDLALYHYGIGWDALLVGNLELASKQQETTLNHALNLGAPFVEALARLFSGHVLHQRGEDKEALRNLSRSLQIARRANARFIEFMGLLLDGQIAFDQGREQKGLKSLANAMMLGREHGYFNTYTWRPEIMTDLCMKALEADIEPAYVKELIRKRGLVPKTPPVEIEQWPWPIKILTLGRFSVLKDDQPVQFSRKTQRRPLELLKAIIAFGGRGVSESQLIEVLWPDAEGDVAHQSLSTTLHRLRRLLGRDDVVERQEGKLTLDARLCWVDLWALERLLSRAEAVISRMERNGEVRPELIRFVDKATELYHGPFLQAEEVSWATPVNDRIRRRLLKVMTIVGKHWEDQQKWQNAVICYEKALEVNPCAEPFYQRLMITYQKLGDRSEMLNVYERCRKTLSAMMGIAPSRETEALQRSLRIS